MNDLEKLDKLREKIDEFDDELVALLNKRASIVQEIGSIKRKCNIPIYVPHRESKVISSILKRNTGPLKDKTLEAIYRELMSGSFALERPIRLGYLGPKGSFSNLAALSYFGSSIELYDILDIKSIFFELIRNNIDYGLVPIENSVCGGIVDTLDAFFNIRDRVFVYAEVLKTIRHSFLAACSKDAVTTIYSRQEIFTQCRDWIVTNYPNARLIFTASSSEAAAALADPDARKCSAAIASDLAAKIYGLNTLATDIEDSVSNVTRFFVISREKAERSGDDKTSIMFITDDEPGALVKVLNAFDQAKINLSHIDKRPNGRNNWNYTFFIDAEGHYSDEKMQQALEQAKKHCNELIVLGSYPKALRTL